MKKILNKNIIYYFATLILLLFFGLIKFVVPEIDKVTKQNQDITQIQSQIVMLQSQVNSASKPSEKPKVSVPVTIYTSPYPGMDIENGSVDLIDQLITMLRASQNRIVEISFNAKPDDPAIPANILSLNMSLNSSFSQFQSFLQAFFNWKYLAAIKDITVTPENGDSNNLSIKLTVDLYINKV